MADQSASLDGSPSGAKVGITASVASDVPSEIESEIEEEAGSYSDDFADGTGTLDKSEPRPDQSVSGGVGASGTYTSAAPSASVHGGKDQDASYSEDFAEATGTFGAATMEEKVEAPSEPEDEEAKRKRALEERRAEIAKRQEADLSKSVIAASASREEASAEVDEEIPSEPEEDFDADDDEASDSMYDPTARQKAEEEERKKKEEEEEKKRKAQEEAELERKRKEEEANRKLAAERKRKAEEEERRRKAEEEERKQKALEEQEQQKKKAVEEEDRRQKAAEEEERSRKAAEAEETRRKAAEEERKRQAAEQEARKIKAAEEERRKAAEEEEKRKVAEEEERKKVAEEEERRKVAEEEERRKAAEEADRREAAEEEQRRKAAEEEEMRIKIQEERQIREAAEEKDRQRINEETERRKKAEEDQQQKITEDERRNQAAEEQRIKHAAEDETKRKHAKEEEKLIREKEESLKKQVEQEDQRKRGEELKKQQMEEDVQRKNEEAVLHKVMDEEKQREEEMEAQNEAQENLLLSRNAAPKIEAKAQDQTPGETGEAAQVGDGNWRLRGSDSEPLLLPVRKREASSEEFRNAVPLQQRQRWEECDNAAARLAWQEDEGGWMNEQRGGSGSSRRWRTSSWWSQQEKENLWQDENSPVDGGKGHAWQSSSGSRFKDNVGQGLWSRGWTEGDWRGSQRRSASADPYLTQQTEMPSPHPWFSETRMPVPSPHAWPRPPDLHSPWALHGSGYFQNLSCSPSPAASPPPGPYGVKPGFSPCSPYFSLHAPYAAWPQPSYSPTAPYAAPSSLPWGLPPPLPVPSASMPQPPPMPQSQAAAPVASFHPMAPIQTAQQPCPFSPCTQQQQARQPQDQQDPSEQPRLYQQQQQYQEPSAQQPNQQLPPSTQLQEPQQVRETQAFHQKQQKSQRTNFPHLPSKLGPSGQDTFNLASDPERNFKDGIRASPKSMESQSEEETLWPSTILRDGRAVETGLPEGDVADFGEALVGAAAVVIDEMLQVKYGYGIDIGDFTAKLLGGSDAYALLSVQRLAAHANATADLWLEDKLHERQLRLKLSWQELSNFSELRRRLRLLPGTASAVAVVTAGGGYLVDAVAAFRTGCSDGASAVGRCCWTGAQKPLRHFSSDDLCSSVALEPVILAVRSQGVTQPAPVLTPEYEGLEALLCKDGARPAPGGGYAPPVPPALLAALHAAAPTPVVLRQMATVLERADVEPEAVQELLSRLVGWLRSSDGHIVAAARRSLAEAPAHVAMVAALRRYSGQREICELGCQVLGRAARHHVENAAAFVSCGAIAEVCRMLERYPAIKELQRHGLYALGCLAHYGGGGSQAASAGALGLAMRAMAAHRTSPSVQINGCELLRCLAELCEAMEELAEVGQSAKKAFPRDSSVHRAADLLLSLVVPRSAASLGALMDSAAADEGVQRNGVCSLGHLAGNGGVAWRGASTVAVSRILRAMANHRRSAEMQAVGLWALGRFVERVEAPASGMQDAAERAKKYHPDSALVCRHADKLIAYLLRQ